MTTPPWHKFLDGRSGILHIDRPATPAVHSGTVTHAVSVSIANDRGVAFRSAKPEGYDGPTTLLRTSGLTSSEIEMITKQPHHQIPVSHKVYEERRKQYRQGL
jgi:hypothetical protein